MQNAAHILTCKMVGDGEGRSLQQREEDPEFCTHVYNFLSAQLAIEGKGLE